MERIADIYCKFLSALTAIGLMVMVTLVFGNAVMRYVFNSGITVSEEISRWIFVWITFLGAVVAIRNRAHLGTDFVVSHMPPVGKKICLVIGHGLMLWVCWLLFQGSLEQTKINMQSLAPSTQLPLAVVYASGIVFAVSAAPMLLLDLWLVLSGRVSDDELVMIKESEENVHVAPPGGDASAKSH